jgi:CHAD domain-containing protein
VSEIETKYSFEGELTLPESMAADVGVDALVALDPLQLKAAYYDTDDLRLARHGVTLRYRTGDHVADRWTVKIPATVGRDEVDFEAPARSVPEGARDLVRAFARGKALRRLVRLETTRRRWSLEGPDGAARAELVDDNVVVYKGSRIADRFRELEIESRDGSLDLLARVGTCLEDLGAIVTNGTPKAMRALGAAAAEPPDVVVPQAIAPSAPASEAVRAAVASAAARLQVNDPRARLGDPEGIHQMRVAARHLRSDLRTFAPLVEETWGKSLSKELKWIAGVLGDVRDLDVLFERLEKAAGDLRADLDPLFELLKARDSDARSRMLEALRSERYDSLLESLIAASTSSPVTDLAGAPSREALPTLIRVRWTELRDAARAVEPTDAEALHEVRILAKRARYAAEAAKVALPKKNARHAARFAELCSRVQDALGVQQDATVAISVVDDAVRSGGSVDFHLAAGRLIEREVQVGADAVSTFRKAWNKLDRKKNVAWMNGS